MTDTQYLIAICMLVALYFRVTAIYYSRSEDGAGAVIVAFAGVVSFSIGIVLFFMWVFGLFVGALE